MKNIVYPNGTNNGSSRVGINVLRILRPIIHTPAAIKLFEYTRLLNPNGNHDWVDVNQINLTLHRLPASFHDYRIIQISDLHIGTWLTIEKLEETVDIVNKYQPDLVAITGDFVSYHPDQYIADITTRLNNLKAKDGRLAVLGNHDHWTNASMIRTHLDKSGITVLSNQIHSILRGNDRINIAGVDDYYVHKDRLDLVLEQLPTDEFTILMAHEPDFVEISSKTGVFDLQLSGHSHGGQILLPFIGPLYLPNHGRKYPRGLYQVDGMYLYTNRGLGTAEIQVRLNCPPEITIFCLNTA